MKSIIWREWAEIKHISVSVAQDDSHDRVSSQTHDWWDLQVHQSRERPKQQAGGEYAKPGRPSPAHRPGPTDVHGDHAFPEQWGNLTKLLTTHHIFWNKSYPGNLQEFMWF